MEQRGNFGHRIRFRGNLGVSLHQGTHTRRGLAELENGRVALGLEGKGGEDGGSVSPLRNVIEKGGWLVLLLFFYSAVQHTRSGRTQTWIPPPPSPSSAAGGRGRSIGKSGLPKREEGKAGLFLIPYYVWPSAFVPAGWFVQTAPMVLVCCDCAHKEQKCPLLLLLLLYSLHPFPCTRRIHWRA